VRLPSIMVPYPGPTALPGEQDIAVYLRPESNGVRVESAMLKALRGDPRFTESIRLVYLANVPGSLIVRRGVVREHYGARFHFARTGKAALTATMRGLFEEAFGTPADAAPIVGAYEALPALGLSPEGLFDVRVPPKHYALILGQSVKLVGGLYVLNYDIPALLAKHNDGTDVFSMLLRSGVAYQEFAELMRSVETALRDSGIVSAATPLSRVLHHAKGPFEQALDALGYLYAADGAPIPLRETTFASFLMERGAPEARILDIVRHPLVRLRSPGGGVSEAEIYQLTRGATYAEALAVLDSVVDTLPVPPDDAAASPGNP
jgi:hypothetical protein